MPRIYIVEGYSLSSKKPTKGEEREERKFEYTVVALDVKDATGVAGYLEKQKPFSHEDEKVGRDEEGGRMTYTEWEYYPPKHIVVTKTVDLGELDAMSRAAYDQAQFCEEK